MRAMRTRCARALVGGVVLAGCGSGATPAPPPTAGAHDAAVAVVVDAGRPIDATAVPTELASADGVVAVATGAVALSRVVDAERGVIVYAPTRAGGKPAATRRCGGDARDAAATYLGNLADYQRAGVITIACEDAAGLAWCRGASTRADVPSLFVAMARDADQVRVVAVGDGVAAAPEQARVARAVQSGTPRCPAAPR
jgi:hypothetical protein